jgi:hypothetical protein
MDYRALSDSLCGSARSWTKLFTTWHELLLGHRHFRAFSPRIKLSFRLELLQCSPILERLLLQ